MKLDPYVVPVLVRAAALFDDEHGIMAEDTAATLDERVVSMLLIVEFMFD